MGPGPPGELPLLPPELLFQRDAPYEPDTSRRFKRASKFDCRIGEICGDEEEEEEGEEELEEDEKNQEDFKNPSGKSRGRRRRPVDAMATRDGQRRGGRRQRGGSSSKEGGKKKDTTVSENDEFDVKLL